MITERRNLLVKQAAKMVREHGQNFYTYLSSNAVEVIGPRTEEGRL